MWEVLGTLFFYFAAIGFLFWTLARIATRMTGIGTPVAMTRALGFLLMFTVAFVPAIVMEIVSQTSTTGPLSFVILIRPIFVWVDKGSLEISSYLEEGAIAFAVGVALWPLWRRVTARTPRFAARGAVSER